MVKSSETLTKVQKEIIEKVSKYIDDNKEALCEHYLSVKTENGKNKNNDIYDVINNDTYNNELLKVSIVILTANYYECEILNLNVYNDSGKKIKQLKDGLQLFDDRYIVKAYIMEINGYFVLHLHAPETGSNTPCGSSDLVRYVGKCEFINPSCIISFGICYGTNYKDYSLGDTLIAEKIYPWSIGIKINNDGWNIKGDDYIIDLRGNAAKLYSRVEKTILSAQNLCPNQKVKLGNMLTAEAVLSSEKVKIQAIHKAYGCNIIGGEMEGYGLAKECIYYNHTNCMILKAICDWGAVKNIDQYISKDKLVSKQSYKDQIQAYTTYCAYKVLYDLFNKRVFDENNIISLTYEALRSKFYSDGSIRKKVFDEFVKKYIDTNLKKYSDISLECKKKVVKKIISGVKTQYFTSINDNECYIFNVFLY